METEPVGRARPDIAGAPRAMGALTRRIAQIWDSVEYRRMVEPEDRHAAFRLRYRGYLRDGKIAPNDAGLLIDEYDDLPNTDTFGIFIGGRLVSTLRICVLTPKFMKSPSADAFGDALRDRLRAGKIIIDPQRLVIDPAAVGQFPELPWLVVRIPTMACIHFGADEGVNSVQVQHRSFYERIFKVTRLAGPVHYEPLDMHIEIYRTDARDMIDDLNARYPFLRSTYLERRALFGRAQRIPGVTSDRRWSGYALAA